MGLKYKIIADMHTHTLASTHAYSTLAEMAQAAWEKGLYAMAFTDHAPAMPGAPGEWFFSSLHQLPLYIKGVKAVMGVEANVMDFDGTLDIDRGPRKTEFKDLDWVIASIHGIEGVDLKNPDIEKSTNLWLNIAKNPKVNVIGHSGSPLFEYDYDRVIPEFGRNHKLVEINAHTFDVRAANAPYCKRIAEACKKHGVPIVVNSDAHFITEVGYFDKALHMLEEIDFPPELIVNGSVERLNEYLSAHTDIERNRSAS